jgi:hypothetical protein
VGKLSLFADDIIKKCKNKTKENTKKLLDTIKTVSQLEECKINFKNQ